MKLRVAKFTRITHFTERSNASDTVHRIRPLPMRAPTRNEGDGKAATLISSPFAVRDIFPRRQLSTTLGTRPLVLRFCACVRRLSVPVQSGLPRRKKKKKEMKRRYCVEDCTRPQDSLTEEVAIPLFSPGCRSPCPPRDSWHTQSQARRCCRPPPSCRCRCQLQSTSGS